MDLILLEPGEPGLFGERSEALAAGLAAETWDGLDFDPGPCIELVSIHQGMKQQVTTDVSNSARTSGRPVVTEFTCVKYVDRTSVRLYDYCLRAQPIGHGVDKPTKIHVLRNSNGTRSSILTISLRDAIISEIQFQSQPDDMPTEMFKVNFTEILWRYGAAAAGASGPVAGWSLSRNRPITSFI